MGFDIIRLTQDALWLVLVVFLPVIGGIIYIFTGRKKALGKVQI